MLWACGHGLTSMSDKVTECQSFSGNSEITVMHISSDGYALGHLHCIAHENPYNGIHFTLSACRSDAFEYSTTVAVVGWNQFGKLLETWAITLKIDYQMALKWPLVWYVNNPSPIVFSIISLWK